MQPGCCEQHLARHVQTAAGQRRLREFADLLVAQVPVEGHRLPVIRRSTVRRADLAARRCIGSGTAMEIAQVGRRDRFSERVLNFKALDIREHVFPYPSRHVQHGMAHRSACTKFTSALG